eukprot:TRINITY_DN3626_c0_g1_i3.p3 TRINITY_DN3626_c0_g1~~TRINITY_DN3626_c0_g1_i3.p3  ORF type:complete len:149 (-),score=30.76 TRINITY_DN3626_c0_g1_i3:902-1348(-)
MCWYMNVREWKPRTSNRNTNKAARVCPLKYHCPESPKRPVSDAMLEADFAMSIERELESAIQIGMAELAASQAYQAEVDATIRTAIDDSENSKETDQYARDLEQQIERDTVLETELEIEEDFGSSALLNDREVTNLIDQELQRLGIED